MLFLKATCSSEKCLFTHNCIFCALVLGIDSVKVTAEACLELKPCLLEVGNNCENRPKGLCNI